MTFDAGTTASPATRFIQFTQTLEITGVSSDLIPRAINPAISYIVDRDANIKRLTGTKVTDYKIIVDYFGGTGIPAVAWSSSNTGVATVDSDGLASYVSNGNATITATVGSSSINEPLSFSTTSGSFVDQFESYVSGSLGKHISDDVDSRLVGKSASSALAIFTTQNHSTATYVRNTNCWCYDWDLTPISPWNSSGGTQRAATLISPRHVIFAAHYAPTVGATVRFIKTDNTVVTKTITAILTHPSYVPEYPDISIGVLDSDVGAGISFCKVLPNNWATKIPALGFNRTIPALALDQEEKATVADWYQELTRSAFYRPTNSKRLEFYEDKIGGDSGNPAIVRIGSDLVILTVWTYGAGGMGTSIRDQKTAINTMMTSLGGGYQLTEVNLSSFTSY